MLENLNKDWLTQGLIDFEYKKYVLLAYLQNIQNQFAQIQLYPALSDLIFHYHNLLEFKKSKTLIYDKFPHQISRTDFEKLKLNYEKIVKDDEIMQELEAIITYALPQFKNILEEGKDIYEYIEKNMEISTVGIMPIQKESGYLLLEEENIKETKIYEYKMTFFENANEKFRAIQTQYLETIVRNIGKTFQSIKLELLKKYTYFTNPATFLVYSKVNCPTNETLLPIAKRMLVRCISKKNE